MKEFLLEKFIEWNPDIVQRMRQTDHSFNSKYQNPHHLEGDVWSHTMMVYILMYNEKNDVMDEIKNLIALGHDIGKIYTRNVFNAPRVAFHNHESASLQTVIDFWYHLKQNYNEKFSKDFFTNDSLHKVLHAISVHIDVMNELKNKNQDNFFKLSNFYFDFYYYIKNLMKADKLGRFRKKGTEIDWFDDIFIEKLRVGNDNINSLNDCQFIFVCGVSGVGKNSVISKLYKLTNHEIFSFDDERINFFKNHHRDMDLNDLTEAELYEKAWKYCNEKNVNFLSDERHLRENLIINNMNLTKKSRKKIINKIRSIYPNSKIGALYLVSDSNEIIRRNNKRTDKEINEQLTNKFMYNQSIPTYHEGFDVVVLKFNEKDKLRFF